MIIETIKPFNGQHCETTATGTLLNQLNMTFSEPMLFGLGEGLGFIFWKMKTMPLPFIGGRIKPDALTANIARNLNLELRVTETSSKGKAWESVRRCIEDGQPVGLKLDCYHLQYFSRPFHFAGHYVALYGYDTENAFLVDTQQQGGLVKTSLESLALARAEKGPMASKNLYYTLHTTTKPYDLNTALLNAIRNNAYDYLNPPITNISYKGILKTSSEVVKWFKISTDIEHDFKTTALLMEKAGTGGALFRNLYRDFLKESNERINNSHLKQGYAAFTEIAERWTSVSLLFEKAGQTGEFTYVQAIADLLKILSEKERVAMQWLAGV